MRKDGKPGLSRVNLALLRRNGIAQAPAYELTSNRLEELLTAARKEGMWDQIGAGLRFAVSPAAWLRAVRPAKPWEEALVQDAAKTAPAAAPEPSASPSQPANENPVHPVLAPSEQEDDVEALSAQVRDIFNRKDKGRPPLDA